MVTFFEVERIIMIRVCTIQKLVISAAFAAALGCTGIPRAQAAAYTLTATPRNLTTQQGSTWSMDVIEKSTTGSAPPVLTLTVSSTNSEGITFAQTNIAQLGTEIVYQLNASTPTTAPINTFGLSAGPFVVWDSSHTVSSLPFGVTVQAATGSWPTVAAPNNVNSWIALPGVDFPGDGLITVNNTFSIGTNSTYWQTIKYITVPALTNNAPIISFDLHAPIPVVPLIQVLRGGVVISSSEAGEWSTQWTYRSYLPFAQAGDVIQLYAASQSATTTTSDYYELYY
jgi:hypothetical protein